MVEEHMTDRIAKAIALSNKAQRRVATEVGVSPQAITKWLKTGSINRENLQKLAQATGVSSAWLLEGKGNPDDQIKSNAVRLPDSAISMVPVIDWDQIGHYVDNPESIASEHIIERLPCPVPISPRGYATTVQGESMVSPHYLVKTYPPGSVIYIDPDKEVKNDSRVIARLDSSEIIFRTYIQEAGQRFLKPLNPEYNNIDMTEGTRVCGVVVCKMMRE